MTTAPRDLELVLSDLRAAVTADAARSMRSDRKRWLIGAAATFALVALAAVALAATTGLFDREVTRADVDARLTTVTRTVQECRAPGDCEPPKAETVRETYLVPADGITFVDPDGRMLLMTPAAGTLGFENPVSSYGRELSRSLAMLRESGSGSFRLPDGGVRALSWTTGQGTLTVKDTHPDGTVSEMTLRSGDIVPLVPGSLDDRPLTPDKAVVVDLARGDYPVWIYPHLNQAYVLAGPWRESNGARVPAEIARRYRLAPADDGGWMLPIDRSGGSWSFPVDDNTVRTIEWKAGEKTVTVVDRDREGHELGREIIAAGRRVNAG